MNDSEKGESKKENIFQMSSTSIFLYFQVVFIDEVESPMKREPRPLRGSLMGSGIANFRKIDNRG